MLTLERSKVAQLIESGDTRWIHRAAYDLMDYQPQAGESSSKMPRGRSLYGSLPAAKKLPETAGTGVHPFVEVSTEGGVGRPAGATGSRGRCGPP